MTDKTTSLVKVLKNDYGLSAPVLSSPDDGVENSTIIVTDTTHSYALKLYNERFRAENIAQFQESLLQAGLPVPAIVHTKTDALTHQAREGYLVLSHFIDGKPIGWNAQLASLPAALTVDIASTLAKIHITSFGMNFGFMLDHRLSVESLLTTSGIDMEMKISKGDLENASKALIHADYTRENILITPSHKSVRSIIDFGDTHFGYISYDIAILLTQIYITKSWGIDLQGISAFWAAYLQHNPVKSVDRKLIVPFMELRNKGLVLEIQHALRENNTQADKLLSISQSAKAKLLLLETHRDKLESIFSAD